MSSANCNCSGPKPIRTLRILQMCNDAMRAGAIGVTFGRNIFQHDNPNEIIKVFACHYNREQTLWQNQIQEKRNKVSINKKCKKIILKPSFYSNSDFSSIPELVGKNHFVEFASLITSIKDKIDLIYIDPLEELNGLDQNSTKIKTIFNSKDADYMIAESEQQLDQISLK